MKKLLLTTDRIIKLAWSDFVNRYRRSYIGSLWSIIYPFTTVLVLWFVFSQAFKAQPNKGEHPFIIWLLAGMSVWHFFAEALTTATQAITGNAFMLKKRAFNLLLLPCIRVLTSLFSHGAFMILVIVMYAIYGVYPSVYWVQLPYYIACTMLLAVGLGLITSSVSVFIPDIDNAVAVFIQLFFWVTPVFWSISMLPPKLSAILALNPMAYLVQGYRDALLGQGWIWDHPMELGIFWGVTLFMLLVGYSLFNRLKPHFADVL